MSNLESSATFWGKSMEQPVVDAVSIESWLVIAGREQRPGSPLNVPPCPASNFILGDRRDTSQPSPDFEAGEENEFPF